MAVASHNRQENAPNFIKKFNVAEMTRPKGMSFDQMWEEFKSSREAGLYGAYKPNRPKSIKSYKQDIVPFFEHLTTEGFEHWNEVPLATIETYIKNIQTSDGAHNSKSHTLRSLKALSTWIGLAPKCAAGQMSGFRNMIPRITRDSSKIFSIPSPEVMQKFWRGFKTGMMWDFRDYVVAGVMLDCGPRSGELRYLKMEHLKLEAQALLIPEEGKSGTRLVPIHPEVVSLIKEWLPIRSRFAKREYVFINDDGGMMGESCLPQSFARNRARTGIQDITPHTVRHFFATHFLVNGGDLPTLKEIIGHTSYDTLNIYLHMASQLGHVKRAHLKASPMANLNNAVFGAAKLKRKRNNGL